MNVYVVGDLVVDVVVAPRGAVVRDSDTPALVRLTGGGSGANAAAWMARAGAEVTLVARVGDDLAGRLLAEDLRASGVTPALTVDPAASTGCIVVMVDKQGRRTMLTDRGASALLGPGDLPELRAPGHLHLSGYTLLGEHSRQAGLAALHRARERGLTTSVTPGTVGPLREVGPERFLEWTAGVDLCVANRDEAHALVSRARTPGDLVRGLAAHYPEAIVTLGGEGAVWAGGGELLHAPARLRIVVDTTGAGDAFAAGVLAAWLAGANRPDALDAAVELAAEAVITSGGRPTGPR